MNRLVVGLALTSSLYVSYAHAETQAEIVAKMLAWRINIPIIKFARVLLFISQTYKILVITTGNLTDAIHPE